MRTRRQVIRSCEGKAGWAKIKLAKNKGKKQKVEGSREGAKGKCNLIKHGWTSRQRAYRLSAAS